MFGALALLGTTLTSYVYIWESVEVAERRSEDASFHRFTRGAAYGMLSVGVIFVFILIASAATLGKRHQTVTTASDMAVALVPLAGPWASTLFGIGLLGSAVLAVPVLAGTTAYVAAHTFGWSAGLDRPFREAQPFYAVLLASLAVGAVAAFAPVSPVALLLWASIAGGLATPLTLAFLALIAGNRKLMGQYRMSRPLAVGAWVITGVVVAASLAFLLTSLPRFS